MEPEPGESSGQRPDAVVSVGHSRLFASLYVELRQLAEHQLRRNAGAPVSPTTLLHEAYLGMRGRDAVFPDRERFIGYAARVMRGLIIDFVRDRRALKRGGDFHFTQLPTQVPELDKEKRICRGYRRRSTSLPCAMQSWRSSSISSISAAIRSMRLQRSAAPQYAPLNATGRRLARCFSIS